MLLSFLPTTVNFDYKMLIIFTLYFVYIYIYKYIYKYKLKRMWKITKALFELNFN